MQSWNKIHISAGHWTGKTRLCSNQQCVGMMIIRKAQGVAKATALCIQKADEHTAYVPFA